MVPVPKRLIRLVDEIKRFLACKAASTVVVRVVTGFLQLDECVGDVDQRILNRFAVQASCESGGDRVPGERGGSIFHRGVIKRTRMAVLQGSAAMARKH